MPLLLTSIYEFAIDTPIYRWKFFTIKHYKNEG